MRLLHRILFRLKALLGQGRLEREMDEELRQHVERLTDENRRRGMDEREARRAAAVRFGGIDSVKEECRDSLGTRFVETLLQDIRYGARSLLRSPSYTAVVALTLALGIGANTAVFSAVRGTLLRPLPYARGAEIVLLQQPAPKSGLPDIGFSVKEIADYREQAKTLEGPVEYHTMNFVLFGGSEPERVRTGVVSANFFDVLEVKPLHGRNFREGEDAHGAEPVLLLSYDYWRKSHAGDPNVVGRTFEMNDRVHTVVGVLPPLPGYPDQNDVYMPASACPFRERGAENRQARLLSAFARVRPGVSREQAGAEVQAIAERLRQQYPDAYTLKDSRAELRPLTEELVRGARPTFLVLLGTVGLILMIACANVANLALARLHGRARELAIRTALGGGRGRILRQLLTESLLLAALGGGIGLSLAMASRELIVRFASRFTPRAAEIQIDGTVLAFTLGVSLLTGLVFGVLPGLPGADALTRAISSEGVRSSSGTRSRSLRSGLVVWQLALSLMLLIGAALTLKSFNKLQQVDAGFQSENVLTAGIDLNWSKYTTPERRADRQRILEFFQPFTDHVRSLPGVTAVGTAWTFPLNSSFSNSGRYQIEGVHSPDDALPAAEVIGVSADYFRTIDVPLVRGRFFDEHDREGGPGAVLVSHSLARRHFRGKDPLGQRISADRGRSWRPIVGVVGDVRQAALDREPKDAVYLPFLEFPGFSPTLFVRTRSEPMALAAEIRRQVHAKDPQAAVSNVRTLEEIRYDSLASPRLTTLLLSLFAAVAMAISATGIGGVIAYSVSQRTQEIGVRMALGAAPSRVMAMLLGQGLRSIAIGLGLGIVGALGLARAVSGLLFGVEPTDPACFVGSAALLVVVSIAACVLPARRATSIEPVLALRTD